MPAPASRWHSLIVSESSSGPEPVRYTLRQWATVGIPGAFVSASGTGEHMRVRVEMGPVTHHCRPVVGELLGPLESTRVVAVDPSSGTVVVDHTPPAKPARRRTVKDQATD